MTDPILEMTSHMSTDQLVAKANDEIRALCLGPNQKGGRRWTMCVPVQMDDSDVVLCSAIRRLQQDMRDQVDREIQRTESATAEFRAVRAKLDQVERQRDKLQAFKTWVHQRLDDAGVPVDPDPSETHRTGCRIGVRLQWIFDQKARP